MKNMLSVTLAALLAAFMLVLATDTAAAQTGNGQGVRSQTGGGPALWSFDDDGDGVPNCQDPDYVQPKNGSGKKLGQGQGVRGGKGSSGYGPGNGTGNSGIGPRDGSGFGAGAGSGLCDGSGPKGNGRGK